ncbi:MAG: autotransporter-associated beta strand repeat-containing protein [Sphingomonadales bacterium]
MLAGTALVPAHAQTANLGGAALTTSTFLNLPGSSGVVPTVITFGTLRVSLAAGSSFTYAGDLNDSGGTFALTKLTANTTLTLSGNNSYSGNTVVSGGTLVAGSNTALSPNSALNIQAPAAALATVDLNGFNNSVRSLVGTANSVLTSTTGPASLTVNNTAATTYSGSLQGQVGLVKRGTGTLTITNVNAATNPTNTTGAISLETGNLRVGSNNALGSGTITVAGASPTLSAVTNSNVSLVNDIVLSGNNNLNLSVASNTGLTLNGVISGTGRLTRTGVGTDVTINGANTYQGGTTVSGGRIKIGNASAFGTGTVTQTQTSFFALANPNQNLTLANNFQLNNSSLQLETPNVGTVWTLSGNINGGPDINLNAAGGGTVLLSGNNTISGFVRLRAGTLGIGAAGAVNGSQGIRVETNNTAIALFADNMVLTSELTTLAGGALSVTFGTGANNVIFNGAIRDGNTAGGNTLAVVKTGSGIFTAGNASADPLLRNIASGGFFVTEGTLNLTGRMANAIAVSSGATLAGTGFHDLGTVTISDGATLSPGSALDGSPAIGKLTLSNLVLGGAASTLFDLGAPSIDTVAPINDLVVVTGNLTLGGTFNFNILPGFGDGSYRLMTYGGALAGSASLGALPGGYDYTLATAGGVVDLIVALQDRYWDGTGPFGNNAVDGGSGTWSAAGTNWTNSTGSSTASWVNGRNAIFTNTGGTVLVDGNFTFNKLTFSADGYVLNPAVGATLGSTAGTIDVTGANTATIDVNLGGSNGLSKTGTGTLILGGANSFTGGLSINGGTVAVSSAGALGADAVTINGAGQTLRFDADMTVANNINGVGNGYGVDTNGNTVNLNGSLSGGGANKLGTGTLVLNNAVNNLPGGLQISDGVVVVSGGLQADVSTGAAGTLAGTGTITGVVTLNDTLSPGGSAGAAGTLNLGALQMGAGATAVFDLGQVGVVGGSNDLVVVGGDLALGGTLTVNPLAGWSIGTGDFRLFNYGGTLSGNLALGGILLAPPADVSYAVNTGVAGQVNLTVSYGGQFNWDGNGTAIDGSITGGAGTWNAAGTNWTNSDGRFNLAWVDSAGTVANFGGAAGGQIDVVGTRTFGTLNFTTGGYTLGGAGGLAVNNSSINAATGTTTVNVAISGSNGLTKTGAGTLLLNAANSYTGGTALNAGTLAVGNNGALGTGALTAANGTTLSIGTAPSQGNFTLGNDIVLNGALSLALNGTTGNLLPDGSIVADGNNVTLGGTISGNGSLSVGGFGAVFLNGNNSYSGGTTATLAALVVGSNTALGTGTVTLNGGVLANVSGSTVTLGNAVSLLGDGSVVGDDTIALNGVISGAGTLNKRGNGILILGGANSFSGETNLSGGTIDVRTSTALGSNSLNVANAGIATSLVAGADNLSLANVVNLDPGSNLTVDTGGNALTLTSGIFGAGRLTKIGSGALALNQGGNFGGGTALNAGTILVGNNQALGIGLLTMQDGTTLKAALANRTLGNNISITGSSNFDSNGLVFTLNGQISGPGTLVKTGTGALILNRANSYGGATTLNQGAIAIGNNAALSGSTVTMASNTVLASGQTDTVIGNAVITQGLGFLNSGTGSFTLNGQISGAGSIRKTNSGNLILNAANLYQGGTDVLAGTLTVGNNGALGTGLVTMSNVTTLAAGADGLAVGNAIDVLGSVTIATGSNGLTLSGTIGNTGGISKTGSGNLILTGTNLYQGGTTLNAGTITVGTNGALGTGGLTMAGGTTLAAGANNLVLGNAIVTEGAGTIATGDNTLTLSGVISGGGSIVKRGGAGNTNATTLGNLILTGANSFTGGIDFQQGTLTIGNSSALGTGTLAYNGQGTRVISGVDNLVIANAISLGSNNTLNNPWDVQGFTTTLNGTISGAGAFAKFGSGTLILGGSNSYQGGTDVLGGTVQVGSNSALGTGGVNLRAGTTLKAGAANLSLANAVATNVGTETIDTQGFSFTLGGVISGAGTIRKTGSGNLILSGSNSFTGGTNLTAGRLTVTNNNSIGTGTLTTTGGTTLQAGIGPNAATISLGNAISLGAGTTTIDLQGTSLLYATNAQVISNGTTLTLNGVISGGGTLRVDPGVLVLNGVNSYSGGTTIDPFTVVNPGTDSAFGTGAISMGASAGILNTSGATRTLANNISGSGMMFGGAAGNDLTLNGTISGSNLNKLGADTLTLNGTNSYTGTTTLYGGNITVGTNSALGTSQLASVEAGLGNRLTAGTTGLTLGNAISIGSNVLEVASGSGTFTLNGVIGGAGALTKIDSGNLVLNRANGYAGGTNLNAGTITVGNNSALGTGTLAMAGGTTLAAGANNLNIGNAVTTAGVDTIATGSNSLTMSGVISGNGSLSKTGSGNLILSGSNGYTGGTALTAGTLTVTNNNSIGTGTLTTTGGTTLQAGLTNNGAVIALANAVVLGAGTTTVDVLGNGKTYNSDGTTTTSGTTLTLGGVVSGAGALNVAGLGNIALNGANSYSGGTTLGFASTAFVGSDSAFGTGNVTLNLAAGIFNNSGAIHTLANNLTLTSAAYFGGTTGSNLTLNGTLSGAGGVTKFGPNTLTLNAANSYGDATSLFGGTIAVGNNTALSSGTLTMAGGTTLVAATSGLTVANSIFMQNNANLDSGAGVFTLSGPISGNGGFTKQGSGELILTGNSSITGASTVTTGTLSVNGTLSNASLALGVNSGATLNGTGTIAGTATLADGATLKVGGSGNGLFTLGNLTLSNGSFVNFDLGAANVLGGPLNDRVVVNGNLVLDGLLNVSQSSGGGAAFTLGIYNLFSYNTLTNNGLDVNSLANGLTGSVQINSLAKQVNLVVAGPNSVVLNWDGTDYTGIVPPGQPLGQGGSGVWNATNTNWTGQAPGEINATWQNNAVGIFGGLGATITVADNFTFGGLGFQADNYVLIGSGSLNTNAATGSFIAVDPGLTARIDTSIGGTGSLSKQGSGTLILGGNNSLSGNVLLTGGTIAITNNNALGTGTLVTSDGTTLRVGTAAGQGPITLGNAVAVTGNLAIAMNGNAGSVTPQGVLTLNGNDLTLNGAVSGTGSITASGLGRLTLNGNNSYSGGTNVNFAALYVGSDTALGTGAVAVGTGYLGNASGATRTLANNIGIATTLTVLGPDNLVLNGVISGNGELVKSTASTLTLNGANSFSNGVQFNGGTIIVGNNAALGTGALSVNSFLPTTLAAGTNGVTLGNSIALLGSSLLTVDSQVASFTLSGVISGSGALTKTGSGNLVLNGNNGYTGGTTLAAGTITVGANSALGTGALGMAGGTTLAAGANNLTVANAITTAGVGTIDTGANSLTLSGVIAGNGSLSKTGSGNLILSGVNSYQGGTALTAGTITVTNNAALSTGGLVMSGGTTLAAGANNLTLANAITTQGVGTVDTGANTLILSGGITGAGSIAKVGSGTLVLNSANSYTGGTALNAGIISIGNGGALGTGALTMAGGTTLLANSNGLSVGNAIATLGIGTIDTGSNSLTLGGVISGAGSIAKIGSGNLLLNGANSYQGGTALNAGTITVGNNSALGSGLVTMANATTLAAGANNLVVGNAFSIGNATVDTGTNNFTLSGNVGGAGLLSKVGSGNLILSGNNSYSGGTNLTAGSLTVTNSNSIGTGTLAVAGGTTVLAGATPNGSAVITLGNAVTLGSGTGTFGLQGNATSYGIDTTVTTNGTTLTLNGAVSGAGALAVTGAGKIILNGANSYGGGTSLGNQVAAFAGTDTAFGTGTITMASSASILNISGSTRTLANGIVLNASALFGGVAGNDLVLNGTISGPGNLFKLGTDTLTLNGNNSYALGTLFYGGTITVGTNTALGTGTLFSIDGGLGNRLTAGTSGLVLANAIDLTGPTLQIDSGTGNFTLNGVIANVGGLSKIGSGNLVLNGANLYGGGTAITAGTVTVGSNTALGTGTVTMANGTTLANNTNNLVVANAFSIGNATVDTGANRFTLSGAIAGAGQLTKAGSGTLVLNGANAYTGGTALTAGTIIIGTNSALGTGTLAMADGTTLSSGVSGLVVGNAVALTGRDTINTGDGTLTLNGVISGSGTLVKTGGANSNNATVLGNLVLNGANSFTGGIDLQQGTIIVGNNTALGTGTLAYNGQGTRVISGVNNLVIANAISLGANNSFNNPWDTQGFTTTLNGTISGAGAFAKFGTGTLILGGNNSYSGGTDLLAGAVQVGTNTALGTGNLNMRAGTTLRAGADTLTLANTISTNAGTETVDTQGFTLTLGGVISGAGTISKMGSGNLILTGSNSYSGGTSLTAGRLTVTNNNSIGTGTLTTSGGTTLQAGIGPNAAPVTLANAIALGAGVTGINLQGSGASYLPDSSVTTNGTTLTLNGVISGTGALSLTGAGKLFLNGANSYSGGTTLADGTTVYVGSDTALGTGTVTMQGVSAVLNSSGGTRTLANSISISGTGGLFGGTAGNDLVLNGVVSGTQLFKLGADTLTLNGANLYSGGTQLSGGTIVVGSNTALGTGLLTSSNNSLGNRLTAGTSGLVLANAVSISSGTLEIDSGTGVFTLNGAISGAGALAKLNSGNLVLNGASSYGGGTAINAGTVTVGNNTALGTGLVTMAGGTTLANNANNLVVANAFSIGNVTVNTGANNFTLSGNVGGTGLLTKVGSGNLILSGSNSYSGGTNLTAGGLTVTNSNSIGTGTLTTTGGTTLIVGTATGANTAVTLANAIVLGAGNTSINLQGSTLSYVVDSSVSTNGAALTIGGSISGAGGLVTTSFGTLTLNGDNLYQGGTQLGARTALYVGTNTAAGTGTITLGDFAGLLNASGATRTLANAIVLSGDPGIVGGLAGNDIVLNGVVSGAGQLYKLGQNTLTLNGSNSTTNRIYLAAGTITVGNNNALGTGLLEADGQYGLGNRLTAGTSGLVIANNVLLSNAVNLAVGSGAGVFTLAGTISGSGGISKQDAGNLVLNGANSYSGGTAVTAGTVTVGTNTALGTGLVTMANGTTLANNANNLVVANAFSIGNATVATGANNFTLAGVIGGTGQLTKTGSGTLILNGANSYSGGTALNAGTIRVGTNNALGTGALAMAAGTVLQAGAANLSLGNAIGMAGGATVDVNGQVLTLGGVISGTGPLAVIDSQSLTGDALILTGLNTYTGGTLVTGSTVQVSQNANLGNNAGGITLVGSTLRTTASFATDRSVTLGTGGGSVDVAAGTTLTTTGVFSGSSLTKLGGGTLALNAANSFTGGTALNAGTIAVGNNSALGTGALAMAGGTTLLSGADGLVLANAISTAGIGTVDTAANTLTLNGVISGAGSISKAGTGTLVVNGSNSHSGGTALTAGTLQVGSNAALGTGTLTMTGGTTLVAGTTGLTTGNAIALLGDVTVNSGASPATYTLSGVISGVGGITKQGSGLLSVSGASSYTGATTVAAGTLNVTGSLTSAVTVNSGAAITGTGTVGALSVLAGGAVSPGVPGTTGTATLTVTGAASLAGTYTAHVVPNANDRITAGGALSVGGALAVAPTGVFSQFNQTFTVASGASRTGSFATVTGLDQFGIPFAPVVDYTSTLVNIRLAPQSLELLGNRFGGIDGNPLEVARAFDRAVAAGYNPQAFFNVYASAAGGTLATTLRQMSGEQRATERRVVLEGNRIIRETALDRLNLGLASMAGQQVSTGDGDRQLTFWLRGAGSWGKTQSGGAATGFRTEQAGLLTGIDMTQNKITVGGMFHYTTTNIDFSVLGGSSRVESVGGSIYAGYRGDSGPVINAGVSLAGTRNTGNRAITLASFAQTLSGTTVGNSAQGFFELGWDLAKSADTKVEPFARLAQVRVNSNALAEAGAVAALTAGKQSYDITVTNLGLRGVTTAGNIGLHGSASWQRTTGDTAAATLIGIAAVGQQSLIRSVPIDRNALNLQAGASVNLSDKIRLGIDYSGLYGSRTKDHGARATLNVAF